MLRVPLLYFVLSNLSGQTLQEFGSIHVVDEEVEASLLVVEGDRLGRGECAPNREQFLRYHLRLVPSIHELVRNAHRNRIVFLDFIVGDLEQRREHS